MPRAAMSARPYGPAGSFAHQGMVVLTIPLDRAIIR